MTTKTLFAAALVLLSLQAGLVRGDDLFRVTFRGRCFPSTNTNSLTAKLTASDLIRRCVGSDFTRRQIRRNFNLIYNATTDSLQVVRSSDGSAVCDVFRFETSASTLKSNRLERLAFILDPDDGRFIGSAVITELPLTNTASGVLKARITGRLQFTESRVLETDTQSDASLSQTNQTTASTNQTIQTSGDLSIGSFAQAGALAAASDAVEICTATFTTGRIIGSIDIDSTSENSSTTTNEVSSVTTNQTGLTTNITTIAQTNITTVPAPPTP